MVEKQKINTIINMENEITLKRADAMLRSFKKLPPAVYNVTPSQVPLIKLFWDELHTYTQATYTFNESYTKIRKDETHQKIPSHLQKVLPKKP